MPSLLFVDTQLSLFRHHENYPGLTYFMVCKELARAIAASICQNEEHEHFTLLRPHHTNDCYELTGFTHDDRLLVQMLNDLEKPTALRLQENLCDLLEWAGNEVVRYWSPSVYVKVFVITDGCASKFTRPAVLPSRVRGGQWRGCLTVFSLTGAQLPAHWVSVCDHFKARGRPTTVVSAGPTDLDSSTLEQFVSSVLSPSLQKQEQPAPTILWSPPDTASHVDVHCGHLSAHLNLVPPIVLPQAWTPAYTHPSGGGHEVTLEIFGFLNLDDLSNPPVNSRHCLVNRVRAESEKQEAKEFLGLLFNALQQTRTAAIGSLTLSDPLPDLHQQQLSAVQQQQLGSQKVGVASRCSQSCLFGFLHQPNDAKNSTLLLSVFHEDCRGLPWLGDFEYLAPVADFAGSHLYEGHSPFPVRLPDRLSYESDSSVGDRKEAMRYVSWAAPGSMSADVTKVLRLVRRLPEKASLFYKELHRLRSAALAYGCPDLLPTLLIMIHQVQNHSQDSSAVTSPLRSHMEKVSSILTIPDLPSGAGAHSAAN